MTHIISSSSYILAFESANFGVSVALTQESIVLGSSIIHTPHPQSYPLIHIISNVMKQAAVTPQHLQGIITTLGPGSFTGLRNAMAIAKAFSFSLPCPVIGLTSFDFIYRATHAVGPLGIILDSHRPEPFCILYKGIGCVLKEPVYVCEKDISDFMEDYTVYDTRLLGFPTADVLGKIAHEQALFSQPDIYPLEAFYLRPPDIG